MWSPSPDASDPSDAHSTADDSSTSTVVTAGSEETDTLLCWICRQPLREAERVTWRDEPVHHDCR
jgi:hypothetical protein